MGDRYPVNMYIGGDIPRDVAVALGQKIVDYGIWPDGHETTAESYGEPMSPQELEQWVIPIHKYGNGPTNYLYLRETEVGYELQEFEAWLQKNHVSFVRESEGYWEVGETTRWCIGDFDKEMDTNESTPSVSMNAVANVAAFLDEGDVFAAQAALAQLIVTLPLLPPFRIVDPAPKRTKRKRRT